MFASEFALEDIFAPSSASSTSSSVRQHLLSSRRRRRAAALPRTHAHARGHNKGAGEAEDADFLHAPEDGYDEYEREEDEDGGEEETSEGEEGEEDELLVQGSLQRAAFVHFM